ncbi:MAG: transposase [Gammaproteobacteria bacterium]|nr:transposase [Gammaproteobacteria bacterium]
MPGVLAKHVAEALDIHEVMLYRWRMEMRRGQIMANKKNINIDPELKAELKRLRKLERDHNLLKEEHTLLKKAIQFSSKRKGKSLSSLK